VTLPAPFVQAGEHLAIELPGARAVFTTRRGGVSKPPYDSLNLGLLTDDEPDAVKRNRETLRAELGVKFAYVRQVHGAEIAVRRSEAELLGPIHEADGQATALRGVAPMVLTADCLPIAIAGDGAVAVVHAGWRGLAAGVIASGVEAVRSLAGAPGLAAAIGPGAGGCCYEVGDEVRAEFAAYGGAARNGQNLDLKAIAREQLLAAGAREVHDVGLCTICTEGFFSHRRDGGITGRQAGLAWLT
jgi:hypothetical protein